MSDRACLAAFLAGRLLDGSLLGRHWSSEARGFWTARARWLEPDLLALP